MAHDIPSKVSSLPADSGYLSDLVEAARMSDKVSERFRSSSGPDHSTESTLTPFDGNLVGSTLWDKELSGAELARKDKQFECMVANIKMPKCFPIEPLPETLARARAEVARQSPKFSLHHNVTSGGDCVLQFKKRTEDGASVKACATVDQDTLEPIKSGFSNTGTAARLEDSISIGDTTTTFNINSQTFRPKNIVVANHRSRAESVEMKILGTSDPLRAVGCSRARRTRNKSLSTATFDSFGRTRAASKYISKIWPDLNGGKKDSRKRKRDDF